MNYLSASSGLWRRARMRFPVSRQLIMRKITVPVLAFLLGLAVAFVIYTYAFKERLSSPREMGRPGADHSSPPPGGPILQKEHAKAWKLLHDGHLREAQYAFLGIILNPALRDEDALHGLVAVRRQMADDDPGVLRRETAEYKDAIRRRVETEEHYTLPAMEALVAANMQAIQEIEAHNKPTAHPLQKSTEASTLPKGPLPEDEVPPSGKPPGHATHAATPAGPQPQIPSTAPASKMAKKLSATPTRRTPSSTPVSAPKASPPPPALVSETPPPPPAPAPQTPPPPGPSPGANNRLYMVRVGPVSDRDRASAIAKQLSAGGFSQTRVVTQTGFRVVSEPLSRSAAEGLAAALAGQGFHSQVEPLGGDAAQLLFGAFTSQKDAETLAQRIGRQGYDAWVRTGTVYTLQLGPYPLSSVNTIGAIIKSGAPDAMVTTDPVP